jgi:hypothetical protein
MRLKFYKQSAVKFVSRINPDERSEIGNLVKFSVFWDVNRIQGLS